MSMMSHGEPYFVQHIEPPFNCEFAEESFHVFLCVFILSSLRGKSYRARLSNAVLYASSQVLSFLRLIPCG